MKRLTEIEVDRRIRPLGYVRIEPYRGALTKISVRCQRCGNSWQVMPNNLFQGVSGCPTCAGRGSRVGRGNKLSSSEIDNRLSGRSIKRLGNYVSNKMPLLWRCLVCSNEWPAAACDIFKGRGCPDCSAGKNESACREIFERLTGCRFPQSWPKFLNGLQLDGYCATLSMAFEYDGPQHYKMVQFFTPTKLQHRQLLRRDRIKNKLCKENGVALIRIPYTTMDKEAFIRRALEDAP